MMSHIIKQFS